LLHFPPKDVFAENYVGQTVSYLAQLKPLEGPSDGTADWAEAVLDQYFKTCRHTERVSEAYASYKKLNPANRQPDWRPYPSKHRLEAGVGIQALHQLALRRRSVRRYLDKTVEFDTVRTAMNVAALSPSACNRQSFRFIFCSSPEKVRAISELPGGITGYAIPSVVVVVGSYKGYFDERDAKVPVIDASMAAMSFVLALETLGLSSVCVSWPCEPEPNAAVRELVHLDDDEFVVMLVGVGYPDPEGKIPYSAKRSVDQLVRPENPVVQTGRQGHREDGAGT
jgi:nitroreductase